ncbi:MAG: TRAP transporter small permease subunit [Spirochaetes bacterium]|nr:TRAP transporter small permease subunit [Spirochaetota bacterium]
MNFFNKLIERVVGYGTNTGALALTTVMLIIVINVIFRIFGGIVAGTYDLIEITIVITAAFAVASTEFHKRHTLVDMLTMHLKKRVQLHLENLSNVISFFYWIIIAASTLILTIKKAAVGEVTDLLRISIIPFRGLWILGLVLVCIVIIYNTKNNVIELRRKK